MDTSKVRQMNSEFFSNNRSKLIKKIGLNSPIVIVANGLMQRSLDNEYKFEQDRNFFYLTGINEPGWVLVIDEKKGEYLIKPSQSDTEKVFNGEPDYQALMKISGINEIIDLASAKKRLKTYKSLQSIINPNKKIANVYTNPYPSEILSALDKKVIDVSKETFVLRSIKQTPEIDQIKNAIVLTSLAFNEAHKKLAELSNEKDIEKILSLSLISNSTEHAYNPIIASGSNACTLHYNSNDQTLKSKGLVLIDVGARSNYYAADVTRTWELNSINDRQHEVLEATKDAFSQIIRSIKPGLGLESYQKTVEEIMLEAISSLKLPSDKIATYFPHSISHGLGLDVHDPIAGYSSFQPGMVITVEPGIYITKEGIGVRWEDDILITTDGVENLSGMIK